MQLNARAGAREFSLDGVEKVLAGVDKNEGAWVQGRDLSGQLGSNRTARAGDHDGPPLDHRGDPGRIKPNGRSLQEIFQLDRTQFDFSIDALHVEEVREPQDFDFLLRRDLDQRLDVACCS